MLSSFYSGLLPSLSVSSVLSVIRKPVHVACIMDGNGRWARKRGLPRTAGHTAGEETLSDVVRAASKREIDYLTVFGFSTEIGFALEQRSNTFLVCIKNSSDGSPNSTKTTYVLTGLGDLSTSLVLKRRFMCSVQFVKRFKTQRRTREWF